MKLTASLLAASAVSETTTSTWPEQLRQGFKNCSKNFFSYFEGQFLVISVIIWKPFEVH